MGVDNKVRSNGPRGDAHAMRTRSLGVEEIRAPGRQRPAARAEKRTADLGHLPGRGVHIRRMLEPEPGLSRLSMVLDGPKNVAECSSILQMQGGLETRRHRFEHRGKCRQTLPTPGASQRNAAEDERWPEANPATTARGPAQERIVGHERVAIQAQAHVHLDEIDARRLHSRQRGTCVLDCSWSQNPVRDDLRSRHADPIVGRRCTSARTRRFCAYSFPVDALSSPVMAGFSTFTRLTLKD